MSFFKNSIYYSKKPGYDPKSIMSTAQREQLHKIYKRYAIRRFKETNSNYDGYGVFGKYEVDMYSGGHFWGSPEYENWPLRRKYDIVIETEDKFKVARKTATLIRSAGYKVEVTERGMLKMWKPKK